MFAQISKVATTHKIAIMGASYGGYATLVGLTFTPEVFACGIDIVGPSNLITLIESIPPYWKPEMAMFQHRIGNLETEEAFLKAFEASGFYGVELVKFETEPWQTVKGIEFRSVTVRAFKGKQGPCFEHNQAVVYQGPFKSVQDDDGHRFERGVRMAVCDKTFKLLQSGPYAGQFAAIEPLTAIDANEVKPFNCKSNARRHPKATKGQDYDATTEACECTEGGACC